MTITPEMWVNFWSKVDKRPGGCWIWTGFLHDGYGQFHPIRTETVFAHRFAYAAIIGEFPKHLSLDHLCRVRDCVNPAHLEVVPIGVNILRGNSPSALAARKTHCIRGHDLAGSDIWINKRGWRVCLTCREIRVTGDSAKV